FTPIFLVFFILVRLPPTSTLFPYTTLFRSLLDQAVAPFRVRDVDDHVGCQRNEPHRSLGLAVDARDPVPDGHAAPLAQAPAHRLDRKSTRLNSSHVKISYAVFCLTKKNTTN